MGQHPVSLSQTDLNDQVERGERRGAKPSKDIWIHIHCATINGNNLVEKHMTTIFFTKIKVNEKIKINN